MRRLALLFAGLVVATLLVIAVPQVVTAVNFFGDACQGAGADSAACSGDNEKITGTDGIILRAAALLSIVASIAAVIVIMVAGIMFITAGGDSGKISNAKNMIIYAVVGLVVIFLARTIVVFVINNV